MNETPNGCTYEELLGELLAQACNAGRLGAEYTAAQHAHACAAAGHNKTRARQRMYAARKEWEAAERLLNKSRARFLARGE